MGLNKISFQSKMPVVIRAPESAQLRVKTPKKSTLTKAVPVLLILVVMATLVFGAQIALSRFVTWNDDGVKEESYNSIAVIITPPARSSRSDELQVNTAETSNTIKGKITVTFTKDKNQPFVDGVVRLKNTSGKIIKESESGKSGVIVFDSVAPGSYVVEGARKGDGRTVQKNATLGSGEFIDVSLSLQLDTPVKITVSVKNSDGSAASDKSFVLWRQRPTEGDEEIPVTTDGQGVFSASNIFPNQDWKLKYDGTEVAAFSVAPSGQNQTINVKTNSN